MHTKILLITLHTTLLCLGIGVMFFKICHCPVNMMSKVKPLARFGPTEKYSKAPLRAFVLLARKLDECKTWNIAYGIYSRSLKGETKKMGLGFLEYLIS